MRSANPRRAVESATGVRRQPGRAGLRWCTAFAAAILAFLVANPTVIEAGLGEPVFLPTPGAESTGNHSSWNTLLARTAKGTIAAAFYNSPSLAAVPGSRTATARSLDGGATWESAVLDTQQIDLTGPQDLVYSAAQDSLFLLGSTDQSVPRTVRLFQSTDEGASYQFVSNVAEGLGALSVLEDSRMSIDNDPASAHYGTIYVVGHDFNSSTGHLFRSTDGGATFDDLAFTAPGGVSPRINAILSAAGGELVVVTLVPGADMYFHKSTDGGATLSAPVAMGARVTGLFPGGEVGTSDAQFRAFPALAQNPATGDIYCVYAGTGATVGDRGDCYMQYSDNGGASWGAPFRIQQASGTNARQWGPQIAFDAAGRGLVTWNDEMWADRFLAYRRTGWAISDPIDATWNSAPTFSLGARNMPLSQLSDSAWSGNNYASYRITERESILPLGDSFLAAYCDTSRGAPGVERQYQADAAVVSIPTTGVNGLIELISVDLVSPVTGIGADGCYRLLPRFRNYGDDYEAIDYTMTLVEAPAGVSLSGGSGNILSVSLAPFSTAASVPAILTVDPSFDCTAGPIRVAVEMTANPSGNVTSAVYTIPSTFTEAAPAHRFPFDAGPLAIPDPTEESTGSVEVSFEVSGLDDSAPIGAVAVSLFATHELVQDLRIELIDPAGYTYELVNFIGYGGDDYGQACPINGLDPNVTFMDLPQWPRIESGTAPYLGTFRPSGDWSELNNRSAATYNGTWRLRVTDQQLLDVGTLECAELQFFARRCHPASPAGASCTAAAVIESTRIPSGSVPPGADIDLGPEECVAIHATLRNTGGQALTNVTATVESLSPAGITLGTQTLAFGTIEPGQLRESLNTVSVQSTAALGLCRSYVDFTMNVVCDQGTFTLPGRLLVSGARVGMLRTGFPATEPIPDNIGIASEAVFGINTGGRPVAHVEVSAHIDHPRIGDLRITVIAPDGTQAIVLQPGASTLSGLGTACLSGATFTDLSTRSLTEPTLTSPVVGRFRPSQSLSVFQNMTSAFADGTWTVRVEDTVSGVAGSFYCAQLLVQSGACDTDPSFSCTPEVRIGEVTIEPGSGDDRVLEPGECAVLNLALKNDSSVEMQGVVLTVDSVTGFGSVDIGTASYPPLAPGAVTSALQSLRLAIPAEFPCPADEPLAISGTITALGGLSFPFTANVPIGYGNDTGELAFEQSAAVAIPDNNPAGVESTITVSGFTGLVSDLRVAMRIAHTFQGDVYAELEAPSGTVARLFGRYGPGSNGSSSKNFGTDCPAGANDLIFAMHSTESLPATPVDDLSGTFRAYDPLFAFAAMEADDVNGVWTLRVRDLSSQDTGTLNCWSLFLSSGECDGTPGGPCVAPTPSATPTESPTPTATETATPSASPTATATATASPSASLSPTATATPTPTATGATATPTATGSTTTPTASASATASPSATGATATPSASATPSQTTGPTPTGGATASPSPSTTASPTDAATATASATPSPSPTLAITPTATPDGPTPSPSPTVPPTDRQPVIDLLLGRTEAVPAGADRNGDGTVDAADVTG